MKLERKKWLMTLIMPETCDLWELDPVIKKHLIKGRFESKLHSQAVINKIISLKAYLSEWRPNLQTWAEELEGSP